MHRRFRSGLCAAAALLLAGCYTLPPAPTDEAPVSSRSAPAAADSSSSIRETKNVSYRGIIEPSGISIYMEGTHRLTLADGRFLLLESPDIDLDQYAGMEVDVFGAIRPTVEAGGMIMRVERMEATGTGTGEVMAPATDTGAMMAAESSASSEAQSPSVPGSTAAPVSSKSSAPSSKSSAPSSKASSASVAPASTRSPAFEAQVATMAKEDIDPARWSQQYCSSHIGFCIPVHRNWWYKSFGATTSVLWHVEISSEEVLNLGDGPIVLHLVSGPVSTKRASDNQVRLEGDTVIGFREWTEGRHFEISAPARLEEAVRYIAQHLTAHDAP